MKSLLPVIAVFAVISTRPAVAQTPDEFPDLLPGAVEKVVRADVGCPTLPFQVETIKSREADERIAILRFESPRVRSVEAHFAWEFPRTSANWDGEGAPPGAWKLRGYLRLDADGWPRVFEPSEKMVAAMADIRIIATSAEAYAVDNDRYPAAEMKDLWRKVVPNYVRRLPVADPWGHPYVYRSAGPHNQGYVIASAGADGTWEMPDHVLTDLSKAIRIDDFKLPGHSSEPGVDLVFANGAYVSWFEVPVVTREKLKELVGCPASEEMTNDGRPQRPPETRIDL